MKNPNYLILIIILAVIAAIAVTAVILLQPKKQELDLQMHCVEITGDADVLWEGTLRLAASMTVYPNQTNTFRFSARAWRELIFRN